MSNQSVQAPVQQNAPPLTSLTSQGYLSVDVAMRSTVAGFDQSLVFSRRSPYSRSSVWHFDVALLLARMSQSRKCASVGRLFENTFSQNTLATFATLRHSAQLGLETACRAGTCFWKLDPQKLFAILAMITHRF
ncbi:MAG: hypothetical protein HQL50_08690 [Magnetococcales bacterium]|nr:hypothetical protein [Magnetococcales bacterium]